MGILDRAGAVIASAEGSLLKLLEEAVRGHRYSEVAQLALLTEQLARLRPPTDGLSLPAVQPVAATPPDPTGSDSRRRARSEVRYPRFEREGDRLVKVAWSKKERRPYEHRASKDVVFAVIESLGARFRPRRGFQSDDIGAVPGPGGPVPAYQVYLTFKWLQSQGIIKKSGKNDYSLTRELTRQDGIMAWEQLPERA